MSLTAIQKVIAIRGLPPSQKLVLFVLAAHADDGFLECSLSQSAVVDESGLALGTARRAMDDLEDKGWIRRQIKRFHNGMRLPDLFTLNLDSQGPEEYPPKKKALIVTSKNKRKKVPGSYYVWSRDNWKCQYCGVDVLEDSEISDDDPNPYSKMATIDHDIPRKRGGTDDLSNLVTACHPCNSQKNTKTGDEYRAILAARPRT